MLRALRYFARSSTGMTAKRHLRLVSILSVLAGVAAVFQLAVWITSDYETIQKLKMGDCTVWVEADRSWECSQGISIRASNGRREIPRVYIGHTIPSEEMRFALIPIPGQLQIVALVESHAEGYAYAILDFGDGEAWPGNMSRDRAFEHLKLLETTSKICLQLSDSMPGGSGFPLQ